MSSKLSLSKDKIKILFLEGIHESALSMMQKSGYSQIRQLTGSLSSEDLKKEISSAHIIGIRSRTNIDKNILKHAESLIAIGCFCIGTNQVDLNAAGERGIVVFNAPFSNTRSVAELVICEIISLMRKIPEKSTIFQPVLHPEPRIGLGGGES